MKKLFGKKFGFTLAEILLALTIIGIIFGISVPALQSATANRERSSQLMKIYPILDNTINWAILENIDVEGIAFGDQDNNGNDKFSQLLVKKLRVGDDCQNTRTAKGGCWADGNLSVGDESFNFNNDSDFYKIRLVDGTSLAIKTIKKCDNNATIDGNTFRHVCAKIYVDINGADPPNKWGKDIFAFVYTKYDEKAKSEAEGKNQSYVYGFQPASTEAKKILEKPQETSGKGQEVKNKNYGNWE